MSQHKTYDTDIITLRRIFAASPGSNLPVQPNLVLTTGQYGEAAFIDPLNISSINALSSFVSILPTAISSLSSVIGQGGGGGGGGNTYNISSVSTVYVYGTANISSAINVYLNPTGLSTQSISAGNVFLSSLNFIDSGTQRIGFLTVSSGTLYLNGSTIQGTITQPNITSTVIGLGTVGYISTVRLAGLVSTANLATLVSTSYLAKQLGSTVVGLGTAGYLSSIPSLGGFISTANLSGFVSTANLAGLVSTANLLSLVSTANLSGLVSTNYLATQIGSTVVGLGTAGYVSTSQLLSTSYGLYQEIQNSPGSAVTPAVLTSTVIGLGTTGYVSTSQLLSTSYGLYQAIQSGPGGVTPANLTSTVIGLGTVGYLSSGAGIVSTSYFTTQLTSTVIGLGTVGYLSTTLSTNRYSLLFTNTLSAGQVFASSIIAKTVSSVTVEAGVIGVPGNTVFYGDGNYLQNLAAANITGTLPYTVYGNQTIPLGSINPIGNLTITGNLNAANLTGLVSTSYLDTQLTSTVIGLGTAGYLSSATGSAVIPGGLVSTANLAGLVSTSFFDTQLTSTVIGLGTAGYLSSATITVVIPGGLVSTANLVNLISTSALNTVLTSTVVGLGTSGYLSTGFSTLIASSFSSSNASFQSLTASSITFGTGSGYLTLPNTIIPYLSVGIINASTILGYTPGGGSVNIGGLVSTSYLDTQLTSTVIGLGTAGYLSSATTAIIPGGLVSTSYLATQLTSSIIGLGTAGYLSTGFSTLIASSFSSSNASFQSLTTSSITFGTGSGFLTLPNTVIPYLSVGILNVSTILGYTPGGGSFSSDYLSVNTLSAGQVFASSIITKTVSSVIVEAKTIGVTGQTFFYGDGTYIQNITGANITGTLPYTVYGSQTIPLGSINPIGNLNIQGNVSAVNASFESLTTSSITFGVGSGYLTLPNTVVPYLSVGILNVSTIIGYTPGGVLILVV